jgi:hypothetical protein
MTEADRRALAVAHVARLRAAEQRRRVAALAGELRAFYYPKQRDFFTSPAKRRATRKTRRAGATAGGCREVIARCLEHAGYRATYVATTRGEARQRAWESDTKSGFLDILRRYGTPMPVAGVEQLQLAGITVEVRAADLALEFSNGSRVNLFGADDARAINKQRGLAKHLYWIDEAQDFRFLAEMFKGVISPSLADFNGECWLTGTPSRDLAGMFFEVTRDEAPLPGWEVHAFAQVDNPHFGATPEERWQRAAESARIENGWSEDDPDFQREYLGRWVRSDARWVYAANAVPLHQLTYAPPRLAGDGFPDLRAALRDLPGYPARDYFLAMGADLGTRDDFALVIWAWSLRDPILYELASWKRPGLDYDEMAQFLMAARNQAVISTVVADAGGGGKPAVMGWSKKWVDRYQIPIIEATKPNKEVAIATLNTDIRTGRIKLREGSPLLTEWLAHRWAPKRSATGRQVEDPGTANHCADAALYAHRETFAHRYREAPCAPERGTAAWLQQEEAEMVRLHCEPDDESPW